jgi:hypothetical protein
MALSHINGRPIGEMIARECTSYSLIGDGVAARDGESVRVDGTTRATIALARTQLRESRGPERRAEKEDGMKGKQGNKQQQSNQGKQSGGRKQGSR